MAEDITKLLEQYPELKAHAEELLAVEEKRAKLHREEAALLGETVTNTQLVKAAAEARASVAQEMSELLQRDTAAIEKKLGKLDKQIEKAEQLGDLGKEQLDDLNKQRDVQYELLGLGKERRKALAEESDTVKKTNSALGKRADMAKDLTDSYGSMVGVSSKWEQSLYGQTLQLLKTEDGFERLSVAMSDTFSVANVGAAIMGVGMSMINAVVEATMLLAYQQDAATASFRKATGAGNDYNKAIIDSQFALRAYGVSAEEAGQATQDLFTNMARFTSLSKPAQEELIKTTALLSKFGVQAGPMFNDLTKGLAMSETQARATTHELFATANALGLPPDVVFKQFGPAAKQLGGHGDDMIRVFKGMAAASKATGIEMGSLLSIAGQFDTFDQGAKAVGSLNAILGGPYFNTIEMLNASEEERVRLMLEGMEASGKSWAAMDKFERMAVANAAGITDMAEANKLFGTSLSEYDMMQAKAEAASMSQEELEEASKNAMSVVEKFKTIMQNFAVSMSPVLDVLGGIADGVLWLQEKMGNWFGVLVLGGGAILAFVGVITTLIGTLGTAALATKALGPVIKGAGKAIGEAGKNAAKAAPGMLAFGAAALMIGGGIFLAASGLALLASAFSQLKGYQILGAAIAIGVFVVAFSALMIVLVALVAGPQAVVVAGAVGVLLSVGAAALMIGLGMGIAAAGVALLAVGVGELFKSMATIPIKQLSLLFSLLTGVASLGPVLALGLAAAGFGFTSMALGLALVFAAIDIDKLKALAELATSIKDMMFGPEGEAAPGGAGGGPRPRSPFTGMVEAVNNLEEENIARARALATVATEYNTKVVTDFGGGAAAPTSPFGSVAGAAGGERMGTASPGGQPVYLVLNDEIFGRLISDAIADRNLK